MILSEVRESFIFSQELHRTMLFYLLMLRDGMLKFDEENAFKICNLPKFVSFFYNEYFLFYDFLKMKKIWQSQKNSLKYVLLYFTH